MDNSQVGDPPTRPPPRHATRPQGYTLDRWNREQWTWDDGLFSAWAGISLAGACYVPIAAVIGVATEVLLTGHSEFFQSVDSLLCAGVSMVVIAVAAGIAMFTAGGILLLVASLPVLYLGLHRHAPLFGVLVGGLAGAVCSLIAYRADYSSSNLAQHVRLFLFLPGLATLCGQIGGGWGICRNRPSQPPAGRPLRFRLQGAFLLTTWMAAFFGIARWGFQFDAPWFGPPLVWVVFQAGTAWLVMQMLAWQGLRTPRLGTGPRSPVE